MGIKTKTIAPFIAAAATAQGAYDEIAQECVADLAEELELNDLQKEVEAAFKKIEKLSDDDFDAYLEEAAKAVKEATLLISLQVLASDGVITADEMENYFAFAELLGIDDEKASELFDDFVEEADDLEIEA